MAFLWLTLVVVATMAWPLSSSARLLEEELIFLFQSNPRVYASSRALGAAREEIGVARAAFLPNLSVSSDLGPEFIDDPSGESTDLWRRTATLSVTQNLFSGFRDSAGFSAAMLDEQLADLDFRLTTQSVLFDAYLAYMDVLRQFELVGLATENKNLIREQLGLEDERVNRGSGIAVDVLLAKARLQLAGERLIVFEGALKNAQARYTQIFGRPPLIDQMVRPEIPLKFVPETLTSASQMVRDANIRLLAAKRRVDLAEQRRRVIAADLWPQLDLVGTARYEEDFNSVEGIERDYAVLLTVKWELFSGFHSQFAISAARARREQAQYTSEDIHRRVEQDAERAFNTLDTALQRVAMLKNAKAIAEEVLDARIKLRRAGNETTINVLDARAEIFNTRINLVSADFDTEVAALRLLVVTGRLTLESLGLDIPQALYDPTK